MNLMTKIGCAALFSGLLTTAAQADISQREDVQNYIDDLVSKHQFERNELQRIFATVKLNPKIIERMERPYEAKPWHHYRPIFVTDTRIAEGVEFFQQHRETLKRAEEAYGVPAEIITAIIGVETRYGRHKGGYPLVESLATLGFDYPRRSKFFLKELEEFLLLSREEGFQTETVMGSYAGAMGKPQFIASSYRHYAIDFNGDGVRDLINSTDDAIGSVANYLKRHGWQRGEAIAVKTNSLADSPRKTGRLKKPSIPLSDWAKQGYQVDEDLAKTLPAILISLENKTDSEHWLGLQNFYAITRYNHSELYAMAVFQLSQAIRQQQTAQE